MKTYNLRENKKERLTNPKEKETYERFTMTDAKCPSRDAKNCMETRYDNKEKK